MTDDDDKTREAFGLDEGTPAALEPSVPLALAQLDGQIIRYNAKRERHVGTVAAKYDEHGHLVVGDKINRGEQPQSEGHDVSGFAMLVVVPSFHKRADELRRQQDIDDASADHEDEQ